MKAFIEFFAILTSAILGFVLVALLVFSLFYIFDEFA